MTPQELIKNLQAEFDNNQRRFLGGLMHSTKFNQWFNEALRRVIDQEIELLEKEIDDNDDGMWTGREFADKWLAHLTSLKELIK